jgi:hypothetical protein
MAYVVGLTVVMQYAFERSLRGDFDRDAKAIYNAALTDYRKLGIRAVVHEEIRRFVEQEKSWKRLDRDFALDKIEELIKSNRVKGKDIPQNHSDL